MFTSAQRGLLSFVLVLLQGQSHSGEQHPCGPPTFACSRTDLKLNQPDAAPKIDFGGLRGANSVFHDSLYNDVEIVRCTDADTDPARPNAGYTVGLGGSGDKTSWNVDDTLLQITDSSATSLIFRYDAARKSCRPVCANGSDDLHCSGGPLYVTSPGVFSKVDPEKYYIFPSANDPGTKVRYIKVKARGKPSEPVVAADFGPALYKGANPDWSAKMLAKLGDVIQPRRHNDAGFELFQAVTEGRTGEQEPSWTNAVEPYRAVNHTPLPLPQWLGPGKMVAVGDKIQPALSRNAGKFLFRATAAGATGSDQPSWCQVPACTVKDHDAAWINVGRSSTLTDGEVTWVKVGRTGRETWVSISGVENRDHVFASGVSYSKPESAQDTGVWAVAYDSAANKLYQLNTYTKIETDFVCTGGKGYECSGGSWKRTPSRMIQSPDNITLHSTVMAFDGVTLDLVCGAGGGPCHHGIHKLWHMGSATWDEVFKDGDGHSAMGYTHFVNSGAGAGSDAPSQKYLTIRATNDADTVYPFWKFSPCVDVTAQRPTFASPPCYPRFDHHLSWEYNLGRDEEPTIGATYTSGSGYPAVSPWQYEIVGISACGRDGEPACPNGYSSDKVWRFGRTLNFDFNPTGWNFYALASIGALSQTGKYYALTSMGLGTMGSIEGAAVCHQGFSWTQSFPYANRAEITPSKNNLRNYTFAASCAGRCLSGATEPSWPQDGRTPIQDGQVSWTPVGLSNCRSDVLIYKLQ